ncbi:hypothetical protein Zmor_027636 [Zophobas morio]|uniref:tRNA (guanine(37)-N1)-methyltransferase n=1 Tax=Zophobas morio TaxID=2755281 RepID=A0AA38HR50_9CUCU|nr:hypothetical protein Zmor_027636 [Zophobas morio]
MTHNPNLLKPPEHVSGLTTLNKSLFEKTVTLPCLVIKDVKISSVLPHVKKFLLKLDNFKPVRNISENEAHIYLNPDLVTRWSDLSADTPLLTESNLQMQTCTLTYDNFSLESVFRAVLPPQIEGTSSFTKVGHIVHVNLREHLLPYKDLIGQVLYEKVPNCRTVVNKVAIIDNTYRNFNMEVLQGDNDMLTSVKENKCVFEFDFSKVYWNSRLCTEHERIVTMVASGDVVFDVFAGVGPFAVPLAKKKCRVFANDLNPESFKWLNHNLKKNKVASGCCDSYNKDGKDFIMNEVRNLLPGFLNTKKVYILMNLPALAVDFLGCFVGLFDDSELVQEFDAPVVVVYCFAKGENCEQIAKDLLFEKVGWDISDKIIDLFRVRTVSSLKEMMRIRFKLDREILVKSGNQKRKQAPESGDLTAKKCCVF